MTLDEMKLDITRILESMGLTKLLDYLNISDFWTAPASTRFHDAEVGGLLRHSYKVAINCRKIASVMGITSPIENLFHFCILLGVTHDLCKVNFYKQDFRNVKDDNGNWNKVPCYSVRDDHTSYGHGMTSYIRLSELIDDKSLVKALELPVIYHMGIYDVSDQAIYGYNKAKEDSPWLLVLQAADSFAASMKED